MIRDASADVPAVEELERQVLGNLDAVIDQLDQALDSITRRETRLAREVLAGDEQIVRGAARIEAECVKIADLATVWVSEERGDVVLLDMIEQVGRLSLTEVSLSRQAFALRNVELAHDAARADADLRALNRQVLGRAVEVRDGREVRDRAMSLFLVACRLERIGDSALDIAEAGVPDRLPRSVKAGHLLTGWRCEFKGSSRIFPIATPVGSNVPPQAAQNQPVAAGDDRTE